MSGALFSTRWHRCLHRLSAVRSDWCPGCILHPEPRVWNPQRLSGNDCHTGWAKSDLYNCRNRLFEANPELAGNGIVTSDCKMIERRSVAALRSAVLCLQVTNALAASYEDVAMLMRAIKKLQIENQNLAKRLSALEAERAKRNQPALPTEHPVSVARQK